MFMHCLYQFVQCRVQLGKVCRLGISKIMVDAQFNGPLMEYIALLGPIIILLVLMCEQSWHQGLLHGVVPLVVGAVRVLLTRWSQRLGGCV
jgi:hypothetical protein